MDRVRKPFGEVELTADQPHSQFATAVAKLELSAVNPVLPRAFRRRSDNGSPLSNREQEIVGFVAQGYDNREIGEAMYITAHTVRNHLNSILHKLQLSDRFELTLWKVGAVDRGKPGGLEKRKKCRYQISLPARYRVLRGLQIGNIGTGEALNISASGVQFTAENGTRLEGWLRLSIDWPILLHGAQPLQLAVEGPVIRSDGRGTVLGIARYEFRTRSR